MNHSVVSPGSVLQFWFGQSEQETLAGMGKWWKKDPELDQSIKDQFGSTVIAAAKGLLDDWQTQAEQCLALVVLLDQFSRNIYRDTAQAFAQDEKALQVSRQGVEMGLDQELPTLQRSMFYMPFMHSECLADQNRCVELYEALEKTAEPHLQKIIQGNIDFAIKHRVIIEQFGRYPHRNQILGRETTDTEAEFLQQPGSSF